MITARWIGRNEMEIPSPAYSKDVTGDGMRRIGPDDPIWDTWADFLESEGQKRPTK